MNYEDFLMKLDKEQKVTLKGKYWDKAFTIITGSKERKNKILPNPLVLSSWHYSDDEEKYERFRLHLKYAHENETWEKLMNYIELLPPEAWYASERKTLET